MEVEGLTVIKNQNKLVLVCMRACKFKYANILILYSAAGLRYDVET